MNTDKMSFAELCEFFSYTPKNRLLTTEEAAEVLGLRPNTLEIKRTYGNGPAFIKPPGCKFVSYNERDLLEYRYAGRRKSTSQPVHATA